MSWLSRFERAYYESYHRVCLFCVTLHTSINRSFFYLLSDPCLDRSLLEPPISGPCGTPGSPQTSLACRGIVSSSSARRKLLLSSKFPSKLYSFIHSHTVNNLFMQDRNRDPPYDFMEKTTPTAAKTGVPTCPGIFPFYLSSYYHSFV